MEPIVLIPDTAFGMFGGVVERNNDVREDVLGVRAEGRHPAFRWKHALITPARSAFITSASFDQQSAFKNTLENGSLRPDRLYLASESRKIGEPIETR
jgi:hypothetical protein